MTDVSRRAFLAAAGAGAAAIWLTADRRDLIAAGRAALQARSFKVLNAADAADIEAATAQIIPTDETPGAREARVVYFVDNALATFAKSQKPSIDKGVKELRRRASKEVKGAKSFAALPNDKQIAVIASLEKDKHEFFDALRFMTVAGMLANPEYGGNYNKTGWKWIGFDDRFSWSAPFGWYDRA
jgi:gluconate 2-dehydrogenase gamma chain